MKKSATVLFFVLGSGLALGQDIPGCVTSGSKTMMIGGKPALRLSDVVMCPADSYEIISSIEIDGQPMVRFKPVQFGKTRCAVIGDPTVVAENKVATPEHSLHCSAN